MKVWSFIKNNDTVVLLLSGVVVCLVLIGLMVADLSGVSGAGELLGSGWFEVILLAGFVSPYFIIKVLGGKE